MHITLLSSMCGFLLGKSIKFSFYSPISLSFLSSLYRGLTFSSSPSSSPEKVKKDSFIVSIDSFEIVGNGKIAKVGDGNILLDVKVFFTYHTIDTSKVYNGVILKVLNDWSVLVQSNEYISCLVHTNTRLLPGDTISFKISKYLPSSSSPFSFSCTGKSIQ
jgi:hypothetical protein